MPKASVKRLIDSKKKNLINFVLDIEKYPEFIPYCIDSKVYERKENDNFILIIADLTIGKGPLKDTYKSDVRFNKNEDMILVTNIDGPLKYLENKWKFTDKGNLTEVNFDVDFEINNRFLNIVMTKSFEFGLNKIADAFQKRAENL
jgi:coenzyme Q-binding protein COQ10